MMVVEQWPDCPRGHPYRPDAVIIGWEPCLCTPGSSGHRSYACHEHGPDLVVLLVPECSRCRSDSARGMGIAGPVAWPD